MIKQRWVQSVLIVLVLLLCAAALCYWFVYFGTGQ